MAELALGAGSSLLGVIRNEAVLLGGVRGDVQFIKEEMESMNSFLLHLTRTAPPGGEHDEQVRTWMNQVRILANDCNNCIDLYLFRGNPDINLPRSGPQRYLHWAPWFLRKMVAQHRAAIQLRELKERARDVGKRRLRYGVEVPARAAGAWSSSAQLDAVHADAPAAAGDCEADEDDDEQVGNDQVVVATAVEPRALEDYLKNKLVAWLKQGQDRNAGTAGSTPTVAIVAPDTEDTCTIAREASAVATIHFNLNVILVEIPAMHWDHGLIWGHIPQTLDILFYVLLELDKSDKVGQGEEKKHGSNTERRRKKDILSKKWRLNGQITANIREMKVFTKIKGIKNKIEQMKTDDHLQPDLEEIMKGTQPLGVFLLALRLLKADTGGGGQEKKEEIAQEKKKEIEQEKKKEILGTVASYNIANTAKKLKLYMESDVLHIKKHGVEQGEVAGTAAAELPISLCDTQYEHILHKVVSKQQAGPDQETKQEATMATALSEDQMTEIVVRRVLQVVQHDKYGSDQQGRTTIKTRMLL